MTSVIDLFFSNGHLPLMKLIRNLLRALSSIAAILYAVLLVDEALPPYDPNMRESDFGIAMSFILFIWFGFGYFQSWRNEKVAGGVFVSWWIALFFTAWLIWNYGNVTVVLGFPICILGVLFLIYSWRNTNRPADHQ